MNFKNNIKRSIFRVDKIPGDSTISLIITHNAIQSPENIALKNKHLQQLIHYGPTKSQIGILEEFSKDFTDRSTNVNMSYNNIPINMSKLIA